MFACLCRNCCIKMWWAPCCLLETSRLKRPIWADWFWQELNRELCQLCKWRPSHPESLMKLSPHVRKPLETGFEGFDWWQHLHVDSKLRRIIYWDTGGKKITVSERLRELHLCKGHGACLQDSGWRERWVPPCPFKIQQTVHAAFQDTKLRISVTGGSGLEAS